MFNTIPGTKESIQRQFNNLANELILSHQIVTKKNCYQLAEIEFYLFNKNWHPDSSTHCNEQQAKTGYWYFHRYKNNTSLKKGRRKGLDISIGNSNENTFGGILIRAIQNTEFENDYIYGPSLVVDRMLSDSGIDIDGTELIEAKPVFDSDYIRLTKNKNDAQIIWNCPRFGLGKYTPVEFINKPYRYFVYPYKQHKEKEKVILPYLKKNHNIDQLKSCFDIKTI